MKRGSQPAAAWYLMAERLSWPAVVSVVGTGRGSGKTTVANVLLEAGLQNKKRLGVIPAGKGGHATPLRLPKDTLVALAKNCELTHHLELREELEANTPWGEVLIGRVRQASEAVIAGPVTLNDTIVAAQRLIAEGAELVVVDGSLGRLSASDSHLAQRYILAMGADPVDRWARKEQLERFHTITLMPKGHWEIPSPSDPRKRGQPAFWNKDRWIPIPELNPGLPAGGYQAAASYQAGQAPGRESYLAGQAPGRESYQAGQAPGRESYQAGQAPGRESYQAADLATAEALYWPGAFTDRATRLLDRFPSPLALLLDQPWHLLASQERWQALWRGGWSFFAREKATLAWVAVNPRALDGHLESPERLLEEARIAFQTVECRQLQ
ncbi:MAG: hypothetical protein NTV33_01315 [Coprothermobacterota bacterium]|nr:hypothetical protein [Coprothermobacterota bacterium]